MSCLGDVFDSNARLSPHHFRLILVADYRLRTQPPDEHYGSLQPGYDIPQITNLGEVEGSLVRAEAAVTGVPPHPSAVGLLLSVVEDPSPKRGDRTGRVVLDRSSKNGVEIGETLGPINEGRDFAPCPRSRRA